MAEINLAYETLCDNARRREYDLEHHVMALAAGAGSMQADVPAPHYQVHGKPGQEDDFPDEAGSHPFAVAVCYACGFIRAVGDRSCSRCGIPFSRAKCSQCNFFNNSGTFVCSICGYTFEPAGGGSRRKEDDFLDGDDEQVDAAEHDSGSEVIRCPQCDEINAYDRGVCWHCRLQF